MANILSPSYAPPSLPPSSTLSHSPKPRGAQNPNNVFFSASQSHAPPLPALEYDAVDLFGSLRASARLGDAALAGAVHACAVKLGGDDSLFGRSLLSTYVKLGLVAEARKVFNGLNRPDLVAYTALISGLAKSGGEIEAVERFSEMRSAGIEPNEFGYVAILTALIQILEIQLGFQVHTMAIKTGYLACVFVANALMSLYGKSGRFDHVRQLFDEIPYRDLTSWNTAMSCIAREGSSREALGLFRAMRRSGFGFGVDKFTVSTLLTVSEFEQGFEIHGLAIKSGLEQNLSVGNALIGFYSKFGTVEDVEALFEEMPVRDVITWTEMVTAYMGFGLVDSALEMFEKSPERNSYSYNSLLAGFYKNGEGLKTLKLFIWMIRNYVELTDFALTIVANACGSIRDGKTSRQIHGFIVKSGCGSNMFIESALLDTYTRCNRMSEADKIFRQCSTDHDRSVFSTAMISGYARNGRFEEAISFFHNSFRATMVVDEVALTTVLGLCGSLAFHEMGKQIHGFCLKSRFTDDLEVSNAVLSMYAKCWNIDDAVKSFDKIMVKDVVSWNGLISGHLLHRQGDKALCFFSEMQKTSVKPDDITVNLVISAYKLTKSNMVNDCRTLFRSLKNPTSDQIAAFIEVLGFWGLFEEAEETLENLPFDPDISAWRALLESSGLRRNVPAGKLAAKRILALTPLGASEFVLVSNLYSASGRFHCSETIRDEMREKGLKKQPGRSWVVIKNEIHSFFARDSSHFQTKDIHSGLEILIRECLKDGYVPDTSFVLHEVEEGQKRDFLFRHSAKLATTFGVLMSAPGKPVRVAKNIALCGDCHEFLKHVSVVTRRDVYLRDSSGFHCFSRGICSCGDYW